MTVKDKLKDQIKDQIEDSTADAINSSTQTGWDAFTGAANNVSSKYRQEQHEGIADGSIDQEKFPDPSSYARYRANQDKVNNQDYNDKVDKNVDGFSVLPANNLATKVGIKQAGEFMKWQNSTLNKGVHTGHQKDSHVLQSPISLDLDGNGIEVLSYQNSSQAVFDFNADGIINHTSWIGKNDGILALDRDGDGQITSGQELFGDSTVLADGSKAANGYEALAELDSNQDGKIDAQDEAFEKLKVWVDADGDGVSDEGELHSLSELGIASLDANYQAVERHLGDGNAIFQQSSYTKTDGTTAEMADVWFSTNSQASFYKEQIKLTDAQAERANLTGIGYLRDLNQAATLSSELSELLAQVENAATKAEQVALIDDLLLAWAKTSPHYNAGDIKVAAINYLEDPTTNNKIPCGTFNQLQANAIANAENIRIDAESMAKIQAAHDKFVLVGQFLGLQTDTFYVAGDKTLDESLKSIEEYYESLCQDAYFGLMLQTRMRPYLEAVILVEENDAAYWDFSGARELFSQVWQENPEKAFIDLAEFLYYAEINSQHVLSKLFADMLSQAQDSGKSNYYFDILGDEIVETLIEREIIDNNEMISTPENDSDNFAAENPDYAEDLSIDLSEEQNYNALQEDDDHIFSSEHEIDEISAEDNAENSDLLNLLDIDDADLSFISSSKDFILSLAENIDQSLESELFDNYLIDQEINSEQITAFIASLGDYFSYENGAEKAEILQINFEII